MNIFEYATRNKSRFSFRGWLSVEDLWDLKVEDLDKIFKDLNSELKEENEESLLNVKTKEQKELSVKIEIIKYIVKIKQEESQKKFNNEIKKQNRQKILEIIKEKEDEELKGKSTEELIAMLED